MSDETPAVPDDDADELAEALAWFGRRSGTDPEGWILDAGDGTGHAAAIVRAALAGHIAPERVLHLRPLWATRIAHLLSSGPVEAAAPVDQCLRELLHALDEPPPRDAPEGTVLGVPVATAAADPDRWDALVDAAPAEVRAALETLRHHVALTTPGADEEAGVVARMLSGDAHHVARDAMGAVLEWAAGQGRCGERVTGSFGRSDPAGVAVCCGPPGHGGWHRSWGGTEWIDSAEMAGLTDPEAQP